VLIAARLRIEEARGRFQGAGRLANPTLGVEMKHDRKFEEGTLTLSLDQSFPITARLRLEKVLSHKAIAAAELEIRDMERKLIAEAQTVAVKLVFLAQQRDLRKQQAGLSASLAQFATKRAQMGEISALDAAQAQVDSQRILLEVNQLEVERVTLTGELRMKLGSVSDTALVVTGGMPTPAAQTRVISSGTGSPQSGQRAMYGPVLRPDYQKAKLAEETARTEVALAKAKKWDDFSAGVLVEGERKRDEPEGLDRSVYMGFRFTVPLPLWNQNQGEIREKQAGARRALLETQALEVDIANEAAMARSEMAANAQLANETREKLMPLVMQQTERLEQAYKRGEVDMLTVLRSREQRLALESAVLDATRNYHLARIRYDAATGRYSGAR
jgi:cobalt-zinc-cadmium efflux system outer membrane protein